ncbi:MAG: hydrogenase formation protein HypD [Candidatus Hydrogenedentota bacterium]
MAGPEAFVDRIGKAADALGRHVRIMEVCGTHTHTIGKAGLRSLFPDSVELVSGPGCPVCVTSQRDIERILLLARKPGVALCSFGDMLRVPGLETSLVDERSHGADVRIVYSPVDALELASREPRREVVFAAVGFETTSPGVASIVLQAHERGLANFSVYASHKLIVPAMKAILEGTSRTPTNSIPLSISIEENSYPRKIWKTLRVITCATSLPIPGFLQGLFPGIRTRFTRRQGTSTMNEGT